MSVNIPLKQARKEESQTPRQRPPEQTLRCPRCDSTNTKFCYYNNYNLTQPRYFCKTCRRYWTKGGALRNIPIGGGCRKNKKTKSKFLIGPDSSSPAALMLNYPPQRVNQFTSSFGENTQNNNLTYVNLDPLGFNQAGDHVSSSSANFQETNGDFVYTNLHDNTSTLTSIEALSSLNQDLHWKLQQQRLAVLFGAGGGAAAAALSERTGENNNQRRESGLQPILFQNLDSASRKEGGSSSGVGGLATEWFFDNHYAPVNIASSTGHDHQSGGGIINSWNGIQAWNHYMNPLP